MSKTKIIKQVSGEILKEFNIFKHTEKHIVKKLKKLQETIPKNNTEKRIIQRVSCIIGGYLQIKQGLIKNEKLELLLSNIYK